MSFRVVCLGGSAGGWKPIYAFSIVRPPIAEGRLSSQHIAISMIDTCCVRFWPMLRLCLSTESNKVCPWNQTGFSLCLPART